MKKPTPSRSPARTAIGLTAVRGGATDAATDAPTADATSLSLMKTKHDTVKNSITNVR